MKLTTFLILVLCCLNQQVKSYTLFDVMNNIQYEVDNMSEEINIDQDYIKNEVELSYFQLKGSNYTLINQKIKKMTQSFLSQESSYLKVFQDMKLRLSVLNELENSRNQYSYRYKEVDNVSANLTDLDCKAISVINNVVFAELNFTFKLLDEGRYSSNESAIHVSYFYTINLSSGQITLIERKLTNAQVEIIRHQISASLNETYTLATSKLKLSELKMMDEKEQETYNQKSINRILKNKSDTSNKPPVICKDICQRVDLNEADIFWYAWGVVVNFQAYTTSSKIYNGKSFQLFIPLDQTKSIRDVLPQFTSLRNLRIPANQQKYFNFYTIQQSVGGLNYTPNIEDVLLLNRLNHIPRTLSLRSFQLFENDKRNDRGVWKYEFNAKQKVLSKQFMDEHNKSIQSNTFIYHSNGQLLSSTELNSRNQEENETYVYDSKNNLIERKSIRHDRLWSHLFFYNGDQIYAYQSTFLKERSQDDIKIMQFNHKQLCYSDLCYALNPAGKVIGVNSTKYTMYQAQFARDANGRMIEGHVENERYNYYYYYDSLDRFVRYEQYEYQRKIKEITYYYEGDTSLPYKQSQVSTQSGNKIMEEELYSWALFD